MEKTKKGAVLFQKEPSNDYDHTRTFQVKNIDKHANIYAYEEEA